MNRFAGFISAAGLVFAVGCGQTDAGITTAVKSKLASDDTVKAYQVDVDTKNHVVTLSGDVNTAVAKDRALQLARNTDGVTDVIDQLRVTDTAATSGRLDSNDVNVPDIDRDDASRTASSAKATVRNGANETKSGAEKAADKTVDATKKAGEKTVDATKKIGSKIKGAVTDNDRDSDNDGH